MDRLEAIRVLNRGSKGVEEWNRWWAANRNSELPDLSDIDLKNASLRGVFLKEMNLSGADLRCADLTEAHLGGADLTKATLNEALLSGSDLGRADLKEADLTQADLTASDLWAANFTHAILTRANLKDSVVGFTRWIDVDLSEVIGLENLRHAAPSSIGVDTLYNSRGKIPGSFLRGCGVPQNLIDYFPSLINGMQPIQYYSCFISHSSADNDFCRRLRGRMQQENLRVWFDEEDMKAGRKLHDQICEAIRIYDKLLLVLSPDSMSSKWVKAEIIKARQRELDLEKVGKKTTVLFPIRLCSFEAIQKWKCFNADTGEDLASVIREYYIPGDFQNWKDHDAFENAFAKLLQDLRASATPAAASRQ